MNDQVPSRGQAPRPAQRSRRALDLRSASDEFAARPWLSAVLALLAAVLGALFLSDWVPLSPHRRYAAGQTWVMALLCGVLVLFFANCARLGFGRRRRTRPP